MYDVTQLVAEETKLKLMEVFVPFVIFTDSFLHGQFGVHVHTMYVLVRVWQKVRDGIKWSAFRRMELGFGACLSECAFAWK